MLQMICNHISNQLNSARIITKEEQEVYTYGLYLILMTLITTSTIVITGVFLKKIGLTLVFLFVLASMRHYSGGYHANRYWQCYLLSCLSYGLVMYSVMNKSWHEKRFILIMGLLVIVYNVAIGSLNSDKNPKTHEEMITRKKRARSLFIGYGIVSLGGILLSRGPMDVWLVIIGSQFIVMLSLLSTQIQRRYFKWKLKRQC